MLEEETQAEIACLVRSGYYDRDRLIEVFTEEMYEPGELDGDDVISAIDAQFTQYELEKLSYPAITDCDRLDTAFATVFTLSGSGSSSHGAISNWSIKGRTQ
jgi:hypothetical protein